MKYTKYNTSLMYNTHQIVINMYHHRSTVNGNGSQGSLGWSRSPDKPRRWLCPCPPLPLERENLVEIL